MYCMSCNILLEMLDALHVKCANVAFSAERCDQALYYPEDASHMTDITINIDSQRREIRRA